MNRIDFSFVPAFCRLYERVEQGPVGSTGLENFFSFSLSHSRKRSKATT